MRSYNRYYAPTDEQRQIWVIKFADQDRGDEIFTTEESAIKAFHFYDQTWTVTLLTTMEVRNGR